MTGRRPWLVVQHMAYEPPGLIAAALEAAGVEATVYRTDQGEPLPPARAIPSHGGVVVMGGPMGVHDDHDHPWLVGERDILEKAVAEGLVVLGVCLGAQQLALALGGEVQRGAGPELGVGEVALTPEGADDPVLGPAGSPLPCLHWHADTFSLPEGAVRLAGSDAYPNQAFRVGERAYGFQFHVEVDATLARTWGPHLGAPDGLPPDQVAPVTAAGTGILERLVALAG